MHRYTHQPAFSLTQRFPPPQNMDYMSTSIRILGFSDKEPENYTIPCLNHTFASSIDSLFFSAKWRLDSDKRMFPAIITEAPKISGLSYSLTKDPACQSWRSSLLTASAAERSPVRFPKFGLRSMLSYLRFHTDSMQSCYSSPSQKLSTD